MIPTGGLLALRFLLGFLVVITSKAISISIQFSGMLVARTRRRHKMNEYPGQQTENA